MPNRLEKVPFELLTRIFQETQDIGYYCSPCLAPRSLRKVSTAEDTIHFGQRIQRS